VLYLVSSHSDSAGLQAWSEAGRSRNVSTPVSWLPVHNLQELSDNNWRPAHLAVAACRTVLPPHPR